MSLFKDKGSALGRENYPGLILKDQALISGTVIENIIKEGIVIDDIQFGFMPGHGTTDAIFKNVWTKVKIFVLLSLILKRFSIGYPVKYYGGLCML